jgi:hypothetical protein
MDGETRAAVLSLGEQIAASLDQHDMLARWMAHHLAEHLQALEAFSGAERVDAEQEVADLIVQLWERRRTMPMREDPLSLADSVVRAVARLDPEAGPFRFFGRFDEDAGPSQAEVEANEALKLALGIDEATGQLVRSLVRYAAMTAVSHDADWIRGAEAMKDATIRDIRRVFDLEENAGEDPISVEQNRIVERAGNLGALLQSTSEALKRSSGVRPRHGGAFPADDGAK